MPKIVKLGNYIEIVPQNKNSNSITKNDVVGISIAKEFIKTKANLNNVNVSDYNRVGNMEFCYATNTARMGDKIAIALNKGKPCYVSKIYPVFRIKDTSILDPDYLMLFFKRDEFDRYARYNSWGSVREIFGWDELCDVEIPLIPIEKQKEYVAVYSNLLKLSRNHERSFGELQKLTDSFMDVMTQKYEMKELGDYIEQTDKRNKDLKYGVNELRGISTGKQFIQSKANTTGVSFAPYKIVEPGEFAYVPDTSRRGDKIALALNEDKPCIVSGIYSTFKTDNSKLLPEYLLLWFKRPEFDRYARFNSWGSARETFDWNEMQRVKLPIPPIEVQKSIIAIHHALEMRKSLNERIKALIKDISPVLIKNAKDLCSEN